MKTHPMEAKLFHANGWMDRETRQSQQSLSVRQLGKIRAQSM